MSLLAALSRLAGLTLLAGLALLPLLAALPGLAALALLSLLPALTLLPLLALLAALSRLSLLALLALLSLLRCLLALLISSLGDALAALLETRDRLLAGGIRGKLLVRFRRLLRGTVEALLRAGKVTIRERIARGLKLIGQLRVDVRVLGRLLLQ